ncbi:NAD-dependent DNA ligase LigA, partial [Oscillatoriales cyanobacterium LEGE 11467]
CGAIVRGAISHWGSRAALDIDGLGEKVARQLTEAGLVQSVADLYDLSIEQIAALDRMGQRSAEKLIGAIAASKTQSWARVLYGLGIRHVGSTNAAAIAARFPKIEKLSGASESDIESIYGIGSEIAKSIVAWFQVPENQTLIARLRSSGLQLESSVASPSTPLPLAGQTFVITGTLPSLKREDAKARIEAAGGKVTSSVSSRTNYLVAGDSAGSKLEKAKTLGIPQLSEVELLKLLEG